ncbi:uncharacterized protein LOC113328576 [Papaver somniferum]|uniref:uncharacterized protein LOC113328576 n=1 Tax=Papaver somniferum TaxID=3469 RepID=UPI000E6F6462|nr:uncharacterized protein LOC113328576 [Papaver somniferum]
MLLERRRRRRVYESFQINGAGSSPLSITYIKCSRKSLTDQLLAISKQYKVHEFGLGIMELGKRMNDLLFKSPAKLLWNALKLEMVKHGKVRRFMSSWTTSGIKAGEIYVFFY